MIRKRDSPGLPGIMVFLILLLIDVTHVHW